MLNFEAVQNEEMTLAELVDGLTGEDLRDLTDEMVDTMLALIAACEDADVLFEPTDPETNDPYAENPEEVNLAWNLGHVIVHTTASAEESAALAAELARGVVYHGRSRYERPWREMKTLAACQHRLQESRRIRLASLEMWPDEPHLENTYEARPGGPRRNAIERFVLGLKHDHSHLEQIKTIVQQSQMARELVSI